MPKANRNNHPLIVRTRRESYYAGRADGFKEGFEAGKAAVRASQAEAYEYKLEGYANVIECLKAINRGLREELYGGTKNVCKDDN